MDLDRFIVTTCCPIDDALREQPLGRPIRSRGPAPILTDSEVLTPEVVGESLGLDRDVAIDRYFRRPCAAFSPALRRVHRTTFARQAADLWAVKGRLRQHPLRRVRPRAERQLGWFHVMQWVTRKLSELLKRHGEALPEAERRELNRLRFLLLACPERRARFSERQRSALARAWELIAGSAVEDALRLRDDLRAVLNTSTSRAEARAQFDALRETWPERFRPWSWRPGEPLPEPVADAEAEGAAGLRGYLEQIMAFFVRHFEQMITYLGRPGVPRTNNHAERDNRRYRAVARGRYGWGSDAGLHAMLTALQGFDSS